MYSYTRAAVWPTTPRSSDRSRPEYTPLHPPRTPTSCSGISGKKRARAIGIPFDGTPGQFNDITDVAGVEVGYATILRGEGPLVVGEGPVRTGVTAILPRGLGGVAMPVMAGPFETNEYLDTIPVDKKLDPAWVRKKLGKD